jgi:hypothetical protein
MMEAVHTSETSVNFNVTTRRYIPEDSKLHIRRRENLKYHEMRCVFFEERHECSNTTGSLLTSVNHPTLFGGVTFLLLYV